MNTMFKLTALSLLLGSVASVASARDADFRQLDTNDDGYVDQAELESYFGTEAAQSILGRDDADGDNRLSRDEAIAADNRDDDPNDPDDDDDLDNPDDDVEVELDDDPNDPEDDDDDDDRDDDDDDDDRDDDRDDNDDDDDDDDD